MTDCADKENNTERQILKAGLPHVAYVLLWFPLFTQPFIFREVKCLRNVLPVEVYSLYGKNARYWSCEMRNEDIPVKRFGLCSIFSILFDTLRAFCKYPVKMFRLFRESCLHRFGNIEILGENLWAFLCGASLARYFLEDGIDLIYSPWPRGAATAARVASHLSGIPYIIAARGDNLNPADPDLELKFADALRVRTNNAADLKRIENFGSGYARGKTFLVYNSLTLPNVRNRQKKLPYGNTPPALCAVGRFDVTKGFDDLLQACAILKRDGVNFRLTLAGGGGKVMGLGDLEKYLRDLRDKLDLADCVDMPGLVSHDELPSLLERQDIFVAPCIIHKSGRRDGIPNTVIEAMACGLPVIGTNINALPEVILHEKSGLLVEANNPEALAEALKYLLDNPQIAREMGEKGAELAHSLFDCQKNALELANALTAAWQNFRHDKNCENLCAE